jgi:two-component system LytT family response regulator
MSIKALIIDDVELARDRIKFLLQDEDVEIIGECGDGNGAVEAINRLQPDLVFLDIQMPEVGGFEVIETIGVDSMPTVIFVTAYDEFAIRAFEVNVIDYLLKPFDKERLTNAVARARREIECKDISKATRLNLEKLIREVKSEEPQYLSRLLIKASGSAKFVLTQEIDWIQANGHYLELHARQGTHLIRERISQLEKRLDPKSFMRIHRSTIVNLDRVQSLQPLFNGDQLVTLNDGVKLHLSRTYLEKFLSRFTV